MRSAGKPSPLPVIRLKIAPAFFLLAVAGFSLASECKVAASAMPDVGRAIEKANAREKLKLETQHLVVRLGEAKRPSAPTQGEVSPSPSKGTTMYQSQEGFGISTARQAPLTKVITVSDGTRTHQVEVPASVDETRIDWKEHFESKRRWEASDASHLSEAAIAADTDTIQKLLAKGVDVAELERTKRIRTIESAASAWYRRSREIGADPLKQKKTASDYIRTIEVLLNAGAYPGSIHPEATSALQAMASVEKGQPNPPGSLELIQVLIDKGATYAVPRGYDGPMAVAAAKENLPLLDVLLRQKVVTQFDKDQALIAAVDARSWDAAVRLLSAGASPNISPSTYGKCCSGTLLEKILTDFARRDFILAMVANKVDLNVKLSSKATPLMHVLHDHELMEAFLKAGADPNFGRMDDGNTALHLAARVRTERAYGVDDAGSGYERRSNPEMRAKSVALLLRYGADPNGVNKSGMTPLMLTTADDENVISLFLKAGARFGDVDAGSAGYYKKNGFPIGPVTWALMEGNETLATALVRREGRLEDVDCGVLYYAAQGGAASTLQALLEMGIGQAAVHEQQGQTPLVAAAAGGHVVTARMLLEKRIADVNEFTRVPFSANPWLRQIGGITPLMAAADWRRVDMVKLLLAAGADVERKDKVGRTALDHALIQSGGAGKEIVRLLAPRTSMHGDTADARKPQDKQFVESVEKEILANFPEGRVAARLTATPTMPTLPGDDSAMEQIACEQSTGFNMFVDSTELGGIAVSACTRNAPRVRELAVNAERNVKAMFDGLVDPGARAKAREAGWGYRSEALGDGMYFYYFPVFAVGHGIAVSYTAVIYSESARNSIVVQASAASVCQNTARTDLLPCRDPVHTMKALASGVMRRQ